MKSRLLALFSVVALVAAIAAASYGSSSAAGSDQGAAQSAPAKKERVTVPFFGNEKCPLSGEAVDKSKFAVLEHQVVYFCCDKCLAKGKDDPKKTVEKAYATVVDLKNKTCPVMGEDNGDSKETVTVMGRKIHLCCDDCPDAVKAAPLAAIAAALDPKLKVFANKTCPISGKPVSPAQIAIADGNVIGLCCEKCVEEVKKDPEKAIAAAAPKKKEKKH